VGKALGVTGRLAGALVALAALVAPAFAGEAISLREIRQGLFGTCFVTDQAGWMVGELGRIFHTTDGGATWQRQAVDTKRPFLAISCIDEKTAWIAGKEGIMYGTRDGGATWTAADTGSARHVFALQFPTALRGHGAGDFGSMVHTEDGGSTWTVSQVPTEVRLPESALDTGVEPGDVNLYAISFGDADHAWMVGEFGIVLASDDGGRTWQQQHAPIESTLFGVHFTDARHGWAVGIDSMILVTRDGGTTWMPQRSPLARRSYYDVFVRGTRGWIVGSSGTVLRSADGGETWAIEPLPIELAANWIRSVWVAPGGAGLAVGAEGLVFRIDGDAFERLGTQQEQL
jgi:photosystem II stability/assembly factor-like uncharacterized protein